MSPFHPDYVRLVLAENFEDAKVLLLEPLMRIHYAHLVMLTECGIIAAPDAHRIRAALDGIDLEQVRAVRYDGMDEDLFFHLERRLTAACGDETAGHLHTARSRNDIDMTMYRMRLREWLLDLAEAQLDLRDVLAGVARRHRDTVFPAHTHTQPAQPTTLAHYLLGAIEQTERDTRRMLAAFETVNRCPLGACAITGTGFPIDRGRTSALLGFAGPTGNTYGSIAAADYLLEGAGAVSVAMVGLGRLIQDLLLWCTVEVGYLRLPDGLVQSSSVMPQKRNPVPFEHARALASKALGQALALPVAVHNTPFGDIVDTEDDLQPLVASVFKDAGRATSLIATALRQAEFDVGRMRERAGAGWVTVTELADVLARDHGLPFRTAHAVAVAVVRRAGDRPSAQLAGIVAAAAAEVAGAEIRLSDEAVRGALSPERFVEVRRTRGGPAPDVVDAALADAEAAIAGDRAAVNSLRDRLADADARLSQAARAL
jgi:argininosuccinate lyase